MASFSLPAIQDHPEGGWGPSPSHIPPKFKDIPYAPYSKADRLGRFADWNDIGAGDGRASGAAFSGARGGAGRGGRGGGQAFGAGSANTFAYFHVEDESSFSLVDNKAIVRGRGGFSRGRGARGYNTTASARGGVRDRGRGANQNFGRGGAQRGARRGWRDWEKSTRTREASVAISPEWAMLEEIEFHRLAKLRLEVDEPEDLASYGRLYAYDKTYDRISTKAERPLQIVDRIRYNTTTSDDPVIQGLAASDSATVFTTDTVLSALMTAPRSVYPWDVVIVKEGDKIFLDKRDGGPFDYISVNENASDPPMDPTPPNPNNPTEKPVLEVPPYNTATSLSLEATYVNQNFMFQCVKEDAPPVEFAKPNPFYGPDDTEPLASCGYRYRLFDLSLSEEEDVRLLVRTEVDAYMPGAPEGQGLMTIRTLNEFDSRAQGAGGAPDWRAKLDSQRGAVVATEMKNNSCKLARWAVQSILAGAEAMRIGYVSRSNPRDNSRHVILTTTTMRPSDFAGQLNVSLANGWGIIRTVTDMVLNKPDGKYVLVKDPNKFVIRLYAVPASAFTAEEDDEEEAAELDGAE